MCLQLVEVYAACGCLYYKHPVDPCHLAGEKNHEVTRNETKVGYACSRHTASSEVLNSSALRQDGSLPPSPARLALKTESGSERRDLVDTEMILDFLSETAIFRRVRENLQNQVFTVPANAMQRLRKSFELFIERFEVEQNTGIMLSASDIQVRLETAYPRQEFAMKERQSHKMQKVPPAEAAEPDLTRLPSICPLAFELSNQILNRLQSDFQTFGVFRHLNDSITSGKAFDRLTRDIWHVFSTSVLDSTASQAGKCICGSYRGSLEICAEWELPEFYRNQLSPGSDLGLALMVAGGAKTAWATRCCDYLEYVWPQRYSLFLKVLEVVCQPSLLGKSYHTYR